MPRRGEKVSIEKRFWAKVLIIDDEDSCWPWLGGTNSIGYGYIRDENGQITGAHKVAFRLQKGYINPNLDVLHTCDNRKCCRGKHLWQGTQLQNMKDMINKNRQSWRHI